MGDEKEQGFVVRDRRGRSEEATPPQPEPPPASSPQAHERHDAGAAAGHLPVNFSSFVISMGSSALMLMGEQLDPQQAAMPLNLPQAKEMIDILSMLEEKTRGNLTADEQTVITDMLYALRMKFVSLTSGKSTLRTP
ncbi:DUF1844 domain-containing protein [Nitrospirales bacterium NOB]|nr:MAG: hypothetical protein UZ03_NOB001001385 [Nitrospira sp. OLB3]MBV6468641.1 hypothetical protein [Nitrospirota bacterium]MCE7963978.1 DUF1844 domain-containing protein [Nitrospira sp. NTP2]MCK6492832.1 DUF1844 domain-containing protein [Nitrospira sp.]MDL1890069.1 DUF1844 domain-containing protein [Nitrospirales bacterium NOB]MEB2337174.1 DUF1844 domain-containing protein [Nitrospirales bacterium]